MFILRPRLSDFTPQEGVKTEGNEHINLKVAGQDGSVVQFKIKRHTPLSKLMKAYCDRQVGFTHTHRVIITTTMAPLSFALRMTSQVNVLFTDERAQNL